MSEELGQDGAAQARQAGDGVSAGTLLREAREAAGLHVAALAVSLKVPVRKLEALEADRLDLLPDLVFVRALAASVCRTLKIDPAPVLARLPQTGIPRLTDSESGINAPFRSPSDGAHPSWLDQLSRPVFLAVFALLLGALVVFLLPSVHDEEPAASAKNEPASVPVPMVYQPPAESPPASMVTLPVAAAVVVTPSATARTPTLTLAKPSPGASAAAPATTVTRSISPSVMQTATASAAKVVAAPAAAAPAPSASGLVVFKARRESWVQVTDVKGVVTLRKLLLPGETVGASGATPLTVTVGSANATDVEVRGKPMDLAPHARDNVARFEVK